MPIGNAWTEKASNPDALAADIGQRIRSAIQWRKWLGAKIEHAMEDAAVSLGVTTRRVRSLARGEANGVAWQEYAALRDAITRDRNEHIAALKARTLELELQAGADVIGQLRLDYGETSCGYGSVGGVGQPQQSVKTR